MGGSGLNRKVKHLLIFFSICKIWDRTNLSDHRLKKLFKNCRIATKFAYLYHSQSEVWYWRHDTQRNNNDCSAKSVILLIVFFLNVIFLSLILLSVVLLIAHLTLVILLCYYVQ